VSGRPSRVALAAVALASALGAVAVEAQPTANGTSDVVLAALLGALVPLAAAHAGPRPWAAALLLATFAALGPWIALGLAAGFWALHAIGRVPRPTPVAGALVGAAVVQLVLRQPGGRFGENLLLSIAAVACLVVPAWNAVEGPAKARLRRVVLVGGGAAALALLGLVLAVVLARQDVETGTSRAQRGLAAARRGDGELAARRLESASRSFRSAQRDLDAWWAKPALLLPVVGQQARSLEVLAGAGADLSLASATSARAAPLEDLTVTDGRLDLDLVRSMAGPLDDVRGALDRARAAAPAADSDWLLPPVARGVREFERSVDVATQEAATAAAAIDVLPDLLGGSGRRNYFVAFGTPAEARELGGFMGAYAILVAEDGELSLGTTGRVRDLNRYLEGRQLTDPSVLPASYVAMLPQRFWHNSTGVADLPAMAEAVDQLWPGQTTWALDGVLYMDPYTLAALLDLTGPIELPDLDEPLTADTAASFLLRDQYVEFPDDDRHDFLVDTATTVFDELTSGPLPGPAAIVDALAPSARERRLLLHSYHPEEQALFERLELDGALPPVDGDFLSVRASNRGLNKVDAMLRRSIAYDVTVDPAAGVVHSTVTVTLENGAPADGLPSNVLRNRLGEPAGTNSTTVAVYTPLELVEVTQDGESIPRGAIEAHDRNRFTALLDVPPGGRVTVVFELEGAIDVRNGYHLDVVPQPMVHPDQLQVRVRGDGSWEPVGDPSWSLPLTESVEVRVPFRFSL
jgi:hypothetical protein